MTVIKQYVGGVWTPIAVGQQGPSGFVQSATAPTDTSLLWLDTTGVASNPAIPVSIVDAKGDLIVGTALDTAARLAVGTNGYALIADSTQTTGTKWAAAGPQDAVAARSGANYWGLPGWCIWNGNTTVNPNSPSTVFYTPFIVTNPITISDVVICVNVAGSAGGMNRLSCYSADGSWQPVSLIADWGEVAISSTGDKIVSGLSTVLTPGRYLARVHADASATRAQYMGYVGSPIGGGFALTPSAAQHVGLMYRTAVTYGAAESNPSPWDAVTVATASASSIASMYRSLVMMRWSAT